MTTRTLVSRVAGRSSGRIPRSETLEGERREIWAFLGTFQGTIGEVPVYNVSVPVMGEDWWVFEMTGSKRVPSEVH